ncbi:porin family protein [Alteromonas oceanisediminis]|uniref:porin family protein n=1 Tax=Alteromonas oceanisediminis TaxID=2836180 RepID=UPI001BDADE2D|nr:porin family protein [Alteromonas oceanisediminis]MBT0585133.1 outer membrane beta-barrel protein [Alteromonas oceanisediminis]
MKLRTLSALIMTLSASGFALNSAHAQSVGDDSYLKGAYVGASYGWLRVDGDDEFDDDKDAYQFNLGYSFNEYFAVEGSYVDFGDYGNDLANADTDGYTLGLKAGFAINDRFTVYAKGGQLWYETEYSVLGVNDDFDDEGMYAGLGLGYVLNQNWTVKFEYTLYDADLDTGDAIEDLDDAEFSTDLKQAALGIEYRF